MDVAALRIVCFDRAWYNGSGRAGFGVSFPVDNVIIPNIWYAVYWPFYPIMGTIFVEVAT